MPASMPARPADWAGRELVICVCGGIAAYKTAMVVSRLVQAGAGVTVAMTRAAQRFITPLTFEALSGRSVHTSLWRAPDPGDVQHLKLTERAQLLIVAPATATMLSRCASGSAAELVSALVLGAACPVLMAPAMNERLWRHPATQRNVALLRGDGVHMVGPDEGWQACRAVGPGRMAEPEAILAEAERIALRSA